MIPNVLVAVFLPAYYLISGALSLVFLQTRELDDGLSVQTVPFPAYFTALCLDDVAPRSSQF